MIRTLPVSIFLLLILNTTAQTQTLPPPPVIRPGNTPSNSFNDNNPSIVTNPPTTEGIDIRRPTTITPKNTNIVKTSTSSTVLYRVQVMGTTEILLNQVKQIEPLAFIRNGEGVIQAGLFQEKHQAEQRMSVLSQEGLSAQIISISQ